jgi:hypothetical protein
MSNAPTLIDLDSQPCDSQDYYGWVETQVYSPTLPQSLPDMQEEVPNTQAEEEEKDLPNTQPAALVDSCTIPYQEQPQASLKRARAESTGSTPSATGATATSNSSLLPIASTCPPPAVKAGINCIPPTATEHRASDPMKFRGTMRHAGISKLEAVSAKSNTS